MTFGEKSLNEVFDNESRSNCISTVSYITLSIYSEILSICETGRMYYSVHCSGIKSYLKEKKELVC